MFSENTLTNITRICLTFSKFTMDEEFYLHEAIHNYKASYHERTDEDLIDFNDDEEDEE